MIEIKTRNGQIITVDDEDADLVAHRRSSMGYLRSGGRALHQVILERKLGRPLKLGELVDHEDLNIRNNCRSNLRLATTTQNNRNRRHSPLAQSPYKGVRQCSKHRWQASICADKKCYYLGRFDSAEAAFEAYCEAGRRLHGEFFRAA